MRTQEAWLMTQEEKRVYLLKKLLSELPQFQKEQNLDTLLPDSEEENKRLLARRALFPLIFFSYRMNI